MSTPAIRAALEQWRDLAQTDLLCPANPAETDWGAVVVAIAATRAALAQPELTRLPPDYIDPEHTGADRHLLQVFYRACQSEGGTADEIHLRGIRAVLAARPTVPPAPESKGEGPKLRAALQRITAHRPIMGSTGDYRQGQLDILKSVQTIATTALETPAAIAAAATASPGLPPRVGHILRLAEIIREVDGKHDLGAAALAEAILAHPGFSGCHDGPAAQPAQVPPTPEAAQVAAPNPHVGPHTIAGSVDDPLHRDD